MNAKSKQSCWTAEFHKFFSIIILVACNLNLSQAREHDDDISNRILRQGTIYIFKNWCFVFAVYGQL